MTFVYLFFTEIILHFKVTSLRDCVLSRLKLLLIPNTVGYTIFFSNVCQLSWLNCVDCVQTLDDYILQPSVQQLRLLHRKMNEKRCMETNDAFISGSNSQAAQGVVAHPVRIALSVTGPMTASVSKRQYRTLTGWEAVSVKTSWKQGRHDETNKTNFSSHDKTNLYFVTVEHS